jgi:hypothetical protein
MTARNGTGLALAAAGLLIAAVVAVLAKGPAPPRLDEASAGSPEKEASATTADGHVRTGPDRKQAYHPPKVTTPALSAFVNREAHGPRVHGDMAARFPRLTSEQDIEAVAGVLTDPREDDTVRHEAAALLARSVSL